ncbi:MAG: hypothetical protein R3301_10705 [Saprospiraceae bacterium]|nr:hypothetical protein [Saprospiraceae bacterium]
MKLILLFALSAFIVFSGCQTDSISTTIDDMPTQLRDQSPFAIYNIMEFEIARTMLRGGEGAAPVHIDNETPENALDPTSGTLVEITGEGIGFTDHFGNTTTTLQLLYDLRSHTAYGFAECVFDLNGATLYFTLSGQRPPETIAAYDGPHQALVLETALFAATGTFADLQFAGASFLLDAEQLTDKAVQTLQTYFMIDGEGAW